MLRCWIIGAAWSRDRGASEAKHERKRVSKKTTNEDTGFREITPISEQAEFCYYSTNTNNGMVFFYKDNVLACTNRFMKPIALTLPTAKAGGFLGQRP